MFIASGKVRCRLKIAKRCVPLAEFDRKEKVECFRSFPRPLSGRGPARVSSHSWSSRPMVHASQDGARSRKEQAYLYMRPR